jgi:DNA mismatch endonuclease (patch repair protein)
MRGNAAPSTSPEARLRSALHRAGLRFRKHVRADASIRCRPDVIFRTERIAVFVDGCFWHGCPKHFRPPRTNATYWNAKITRNQARDRQHDEQLSAAGWKVIRVWEHDAVNVMVTQIRAAVLARREDGKAHRTRPTAR